jgi:hypothetical protein
MNTLRKRPTYNGLVDYLNNQPTIKYPTRKGIKIINDTIISNLMYDDDTIEDMFIEETEEMVEAQKEKLIKSMKESTTQTPYDQGTQTDTLNKGTQKDFIPDYDDEDIEKRPHMYWKINAMSERRTHNPYWFFKPREKNDATSETIESKDNELKDNISQTSRYIPGSLKRKSDNINQTVRYMLKKFENPVPTPSEHSEAESSDSSSIPPSEPSPPPSIASSGYKKKNTPSVQSEESEPKLSPRDGVMEIPYPVVDEEPEADTDPYMEEPLDEEELEMFWYNSKNKQKRKKK